MGSQSAIRNPLPVKSTMPFIWTFKSISEIAQYDSEIARKSLAGSTQMGSGWKKNIVKYSQDSRIKTLFAEIFNF
jgi:hypothetical protein